MVSATNISHKPLRLGFVAYLVFQRDPEVVFAKFVYGGLGYKGQQTIMFWKNVWCFGLGAPGPPKKHLAKKPLRDLVDAYPVLCVAR